MISVASFLACQQARTGFSIVLLRRCAKGYHQIGSPLSAICDI
jgi:hypothetical protein